MSVSVEALYERWERELAQMRRPPDPVVIAALEFEAHEQGYDLLDIHRALIGAPFFDETLHPRGKDGKFIEKGGLVRLLNFKFRGKNGKDYDFHGQRGKVLGITPDKKSNKLPPDIRVGVLRPDQADTDTPSTIINVKPNNVEEAPEKGRLALPDERAELEGQIPTDVGEDDAALLDKLRARVHRGNEKLNRAADWVTEREGTDESEAAQPDSIEARRLALTAQINAATADLSTTSGEERYTQLEAIMAPPKPAKGLRGAIIDTDQVHDHIGPPDKDGKLRYTPERTAQHEEMWADLLAQVRAAGIPQDRDALALGGLPGAGKTFSLKPGEAASEFGVLSWEPNGVNSPDPGTTHVSINPDAVKEMMIHRGMLPEGIENLKPMEQATFIHEESSTISKMFAARLSAEDFNMVLDNTMDSSEKMEERMIPMAQNGYTFRALFVDVPPEESKQSVKDRYVRAALTEEGGRFVPSSVMGNRSTDTGRMSKNRDAFDELTETKWFTEWIVIDNTGLVDGHPKKEVTARGTSDGSAATKLQIIPRPSIGEQYLDTVTLPEEDVQAMANQVMDGQPITEPPPIPGTDVDNIILHFASSPHPVDLTLMPQFSLMRENGIPRSEMPQIPKQHQQTFEERLRESGINVNPEVIDPQQLKPTQSQLDGKSVGEIIDSIRSGRFDPTSKPIWISSDGRVLDGHHRWAATSALSANCGGNGCIQVPVMRVDMSMDELLNFANNFNDEMGVERLEFGERLPTAPVVPGAPAAPAAPAAPVAAAGTPPPEPDENGFYGMATDEEDGITDEDLEGLPVGDGSAFPGYQLPSEQQDEDEEPESGE